MGPRDRSARGRELITLTPFLLGAILVALASTVVVVAAWHAAAGPPQPAAGTSSAAQANLIVAVGFAAAAWASVFFAVSRDMILRRIDELGERIDRNTLDLADELARTASDIAMQAEETGVFRGMEIEAGRDGPAPPQRSGGGRVLPRPTEGVHDRPERPFRVQ
ncbi:MAG TPA: hypothetical protein VH561_06305 [Micromonosporaceae bacterium]